MASTHVELYEALKGTVGEDAAKMIAEIIPPAQNVATRLDVAEVRLEVAGMDGRLQAQIAEMDGRLQAQIAEMDGHLQAQIKESSQQTLRWMLGFFIPVWLGSWGTVVAVVLKG